MYSLEVCTRCRTAKRSGTPNGIRTRAATLKGWCPRPLDDGGLGTRLDESVATLTELSAVSTRRLAPAVVLHEGVLRGGVLHEGRDGTIKKPRQEVVEGEFVMARIVFIEVIIDFSNT